MVPDKVQPVFIELFKKCAILKIINSKFNG